MTLAADAKKVAAQFSKVAKVKALTEQLRDAYGTSLTRKDLKEFEKRHKLVVQWVARREDPVQTFRTPLGFVRPVGARGWYTIPGLKDAPVPDRDVSYGPAADCRVPPGGEEQAVASMLGVDAEPTLKEIVVDGDIVVTEVLVNEAGTPVTVTAPEVLPDPPLSADEQAVAARLGLEDSTGV
tara:strand:+ start:354 stop:899 length:546 start_codon:yes stop_codon:yes gene_type:complete